MRSPAALPLLLPLLLPACAHRSAPPPPAPDHVAPDAPDQAWRWRQLRWQDEHHQILPGALQRALAQRDANLAAQATPSNAGISRLAWRSRGPDNVGGRTRALLISPTDRNRLWAGAVGGGIWTSADAGTTWSRYDDWLPNLAVCCLAMDPRDARVLYAGTGEGFFNGDAIGGQGIYKSTDSGVSWARLPSTASWDNVCRIAVSPLDSNLILASKRYGGIQRSTDGGATWSNPYWAQGSYQVAFKPGSGSECIAQVIDYDFGQNTWFHRVLTSSDAGLTWSPAASGLGRVDGFDARIELAYAPSAPNTVYALCAAGGGVVWRSQDGGRNFTLRTTSGGAGSSWYACPIWVDPTNANRLVVGGGAIFRSSDGGTSLQQISSGYIQTVQPHPDIHFFASDPGYNGTSNKRFYVCTDGGVWRTDDITTASSASGWINRDRGYRTSQFYGAAGDGATGRIVGGTQDNGTLKLEATSDLAVLPFGGDGGFCAIDWVDPRYCYGEYINLQLHRSADGGNTAGYIHGGITDAGSAANFIAPFILDPTDPARLLAGGRSLWRTHNARAMPPTWTAIRGPDTDNLSAIAVAPGNANVIWVGQNDGRIARTSNGLAAAPTWTFVDDNASVDPLPNRFVTRLVIDDADPNVVYACFGGFSPDNLWQTRNGGATWADITGAGATGLPDAPINGLARHPAAAGYLYAATEVGVFASDNSGRTWSTSNDGPGNIAGDELVFFKGRPTLLLATHGRGLWTADVAVPGWVAYGASCPGTFGTPLLLAEPGHPPVVGGNFQLRLWGMRQNSAAILLTGVSSTTWAGVPLPLALAPLGMPGCQLWCSAEFVTAVATGNGSVATGFTLPGDVSLARSHVYNQALILDPGFNAAGLVATNGGDATIGY